MRCSLSSPAQWVSKSPVSSNILSISGLYPGSVVTRNATDPGTGPDTL